MATSDQLQAPAAQRRSSSRIWPRRRRSSDGQLVLVSWVVNRCGMSVRANAIA
jgi:hypothetical protein